MANHRLSSELLSSLLAALPPRVSTLSSASAASNAARAENELIRDFLATTPLAYIIDTLTQDKSPSSGDLHGAARDLAARVLMRVLESGVGDALVLDPGMLPFLAGGIRDSVGEISYTTLRCVRDKLSRTSIGVRHIVGTELLPALVARLASEDIRSAQLASEALREAAATALLGSDERNPVMCIVVALCSFAAREGVDATVLLRCADLLARIAGLSEVAFGVCEAEGRLGLVMGLVESDDPLVQLNAYDLLELLAQTPAGIRHLFQSGTVGRLLATATGDGTAQGEPDPLLGGNALQVLGGIFSSAGKLSAPAGRSSLASAGGGEEEGKETTTTGGGGHDAAVGLWDEIETGVVRSFLHAVMLHSGGEESDQASLTAAACAVSEFAASSPRALEAVVGDKLVVGRWLGLVRHPMAPLKCACLHTLANALRSEGGDDLHQRLFAEFAEQSAGGASGGGGVDTLVRLVQQPFEELRHAAYDTLRALAQQSGGWGIQLMFSFAGFAELIQNRDTERTKEGKEWKFAVIEAIMRNPSNGLLGQDITDALAGMLVAGPFHMGTSAPEVAVEG